MDTKIGLFSIREKDEALKLDGNVIFLNHLFTMEYENLVQRIISDVDICACIDGSPKHRIKAIWDTGALTSCISNKLARKMGLQVVDTGIGVTPTGQTEIQYYFVDVHISDDIIIPNVCVAGFPLENHDVNFLVGMDIITKGDLSIRNVEGKTKIEFRIDKE